MKSILRLFSRRILLLIQMMILIIFTFIAYSSKIIPFKYLIAIDVIALIIFLGLYRGQIHPEKHRLKSTIYKIISIVVMIALVIGCISFVQSTHFLDSITGAQTQTVEVSVLVREGSYYQDITDLEGETFGTCQSGDSVNTTKALSLIEEDIGTLAVEDYESLNLAVQALYNLEIEAMVLKEVDRDNLDDEIEDLDERTRVIKTYKIEISTAKANQVDVTKEPFNVFICGTDQSGDITTAGLSDVNMIATINPNTSQIYLTSIPRDYYVDIYGYEGKDKLTHSAKSPEGITCTMKTIENFMDIKFNYYVKLNFTSFMNIVDAIGGVDIDIPVYETKNSDDGSFTTKIYKYEMSPGLTHMDAKMALAFVRERKSFIDGDRIRGQNQQLMIKAIVNKICTPSIIVKLNSIFDAVSDSLETNMTSAEIRSLIKMQLNSMVSWDVLSYHLDGSDDRAFEFATIMGGISNPNGLSIMVPYQSTIDKAKGYIDTVMANEILELDEDDE